MLNRQVLGHLAVCLPDGIPSWGGAHTLYFPGPQFSWALGTALANENDPTTMQLSLYKDHMN